MFLSVFKDLGVNRRRLKDKQKNEIDRNQSGNVFSSLMRVDRRMSDRGIEREVIDGRKDTCADGEIRLDFGLFLKIRLGLINTYGPSFSSIYLFMNVCLRCVFFVRPYCEPLR